MNILEVIKQYGSIFAILTTVIGWLLQERSMRQTLKRRDEEIRLKDEEIHRTLAQKDEDIRLKGEEIRHRIEIDLKEFNEKFITVVERMNGWLKDLPSPAELNDKLNVDFGNPFLIGIHVNQPDLFYGRKDILQSVISCAYGVQMQSVQILGVKRSGKTSFLHFLEYSVLRQMSKIIPVYIDARAQFISPENFYAYLLREMFKNLEKRNKNTQGSPNVPNWIPFETLSNSIEQLSNKQWGFLILLDDFTYLTNNPNLDEKFFGALRSLVLTGNIAFIISAFENIEQSKTFTSPFANIFTEFHYLGPLSDQDARNLIKEPATRFCHQFENEDIDFIIKVAGKMPYNIQKASSLLYDLHKKGLTGHEGCMQMKNEFITSMENRFIKQLKQLKDEEIGSLVKVSKKLSNTCFPRTLERLENYGFIEKVDGHYKVLGEAFADYLTHFKA